MTDSSDNTGRAQRASEAYRKVIEEAKEFDREVSPGDRWGPLGWKGGDYRETWFGSPSRATDTLEWIQHGWYGLYEDATPEQQQRAGELAQQITAARAEYAQALREEARQRAAEDAPRIRQQMAEEYSAKEAYWRGNQDRLYYPHERSEAKRFEEIHGRPPRLHRPDLPYALRRAMGDEV